MTEKMKKTSLKWCSCGYRMRHAKAGDLQAVRLHAEGTHHKQGKKETKP